MAHDVFISHSGKDKTVADAVCATLEKGGTRCWIAPRDIVPGTQWGEAIIDAISNCKVMVLVFSSNANESQQIVREVERAVNKGIPVIPFRVEDVDPNKSLEYYISAPHWLDALTPPLEQHIEQLNSTIKLLLARQGEEASHEDTSQDQATAEVTEDAGSTERIEEIRDDRDKGKTGVTQSLSPKKIGGGIAVVIILLLGFFIFSGENGDEVNDITNGDKITDYSPTPVDNNSEETPPTEGEQWGALALTPAGGWGYSTNQPTKRAAEQEAMVKCSSQNHDCELAKSFNNCMAYSRAPDGTTAWGTHENLDTAREASVSKCHEFTTQTCVSHVELCADGSVKRVNVWGAIATADNAEFGKSWNFPTRSDAESAAMEECRIKGTNCILRMSFTTCGAVARGEDGALGWARNSSMDEAINRAYKECQTQTSTECSLLTKVCADGSESG